MTPLGLQFKLDELGSEPRDLAGEVKEPALDEVLLGMVGALGYRAPAPAQVRGRVWLDGKDVLLRGVVSAGAQFDCVRCLTSRTIEIDRPFDHLLSPRGAEAGAGELVISDDDLADDVDVSFYQGEGVDLGGLVRELVLLGLPMNPTCADAGEGCDESRLRAARSPEPESTVDPRWAGLLKLKNKLTSSG